MRAAWTALLLALGLVLAACGGDSPPDDGFGSIATGDTGGEWELLAEFEGGEWTGCLRIDHYVVRTECTDPGVDELVSFESGEGVVYGVVPDGATLLRTDDGEEEEVALHDGRFFVVSSEVDVRLAD